MNQAFIRELKKIKRRRNLTQKRIIDEFVWEIFDFISNYFSEEQNIL